MLDALEQLSKAWPIVLSLTGGGAWLIRLEAKVMNLERELREKKDHDEVKEKALWDRFEKVLEKIQGVAEALARMEGQLLGKNKEN